MKQKIIIAIFTFMLGTSFFYSQTGNVGIGTSSPQATLDINGNLRIATVPDIGSATTDNVLTLGDGTTTSTDGSTNVVNMIKLSNLPSSSILDSKIYALFVPPNPYPLTSSSLTRVAGWVMNGSGVNYSKVTYNASSGTYTLPKNKIFKIKGDIGVLGKTNNMTAQGGAGGYIMTRWVVDSGSGDYAIYFVSDGYTESSTEEYDDGGVTNPIMVIYTGSTGVTIHLEALRAGRNYTSGTVYMSGLPASFPTLGSLITIMEI